MCRASGQAGPGAWSAHGALTGRSVRSRQTPPRPHAVIALSVLSFHCSLWAWAARPCPVGQHRPGSHLPPGCSLRPSLPCATSQSPHRPQAWRPLVTPKTPAPEAPPLLRPQSQQGCLLGSSSEEDPVAWPGLAPLPSASHPESGQVHGADPFCMYIRITTLSLGSKVTHAGVWCDGRAQALVAPPKLLALHSSLQEHIWG